MESCFAWNYHRGRWTYVRGDGVKILGRTGDLPVLVEQGNLLAATFHPELTADETIHRYFLKKTASG